jgi:hypothetical protein
VTVYALGSYINSYTVLAGTSTGSYTSIGVGGNDPNNNTWAMSFSFAVKAGAYYYLQSPSWNGYAFENLNMYEWYN